MTNPYGIRMRVRMAPLPTRVRYMTRAKAIPSANSMATEITVMITVITNAFHQ